MFGQNDDSNQSEPLIAPDAALSAAMPDPITASDPPAGFNIPANQPALDDSAGSGEGAPDLPPTSAPDPSTAEPLDSDPTAGPAPDSTPDDSAKAPAPGSNDLVDIKQQALQHLSPLVGHLDQTPEEKFRTTMMMIQASDNKDLVKDAFEAAQAITDDKARAQALLDVINEINYFTQSEA